MAEIGVDAVKVRSLYEKPQMPSDVAELGSRGFDYQSEILPLADRLRFLDFAKACAAKQRSEAHKRTRFLQGTRRDRRANLQ